MRAALKWIGGIGLALLGLFTFWRRSPAAPPAPVPGRLDADRVERAREDAAEAKREASDAAAEAHHDAQRDRPLVDRAQDRIDRARARKAGALCLVGALLAGAPARSADRDCVEDARAQVVTCTSVGFAAMLDDADAIEEERAKAVGRVLELEAKLAASKEHRTTVDALPAPAPPSVLPWFLAGVASGAALAAGFVLLAR